MQYILYFLLAFILADFFSGLFHWWEDRYGNPNWPIIGPLVIEPNINHHKNPKDFTKGNYLKRNYTTLIPTILLTTICWIYNNYFLMLVFLLASQSNEVHCWQHTKPNILIRFLQKYQIIQGARMHSLHHKNPYSKNYCVMTVLINPILTRINFWETVEEFIGFLTGIYPRKEREIY